MPGNIEGWIARQIGPFLPHRDPALERSVGIRCEGLKHAGFEENIAIVLVELPVSLLAAKALRQITDAIPRREISLMIRRLMGPD